MDATESRLEATTPVRFKTDDFIALAAKRGVRLHGDRADLLGINRSTLDRWQDGDAVPRLDTALQVAKKLGVRVEDLWDLADAEVLA